MLNVVQCLYANHWPIFCILDEKGRIMLCRQTEKEVGQMLKATELAKGGRPEKTGNTVAPVIEPTLSEIGITKRQSSEVRP